MSYEICFIIGSLMNEIWNWWIPREQSPMEYILATVKFGGPGIISWGCYPGSLVPVRGNVNVTVYSVQTDN